MNDPRKPHDRDPAVDPSLLDELYALAAGHADGQLNREEKQRLESLLVDHSDLCDRFLDYMQMMSALENEPTRLREYLAQGTDISDELQDASPSVIPSFDINDPDAITKEVMGQQEAPAAGSPVLGFLGDCIKTGFSFLSRPNVLSILLAVGLPVLILVVLAIQLPDRPASRQLVATITQTHECVWSKEGQSLPVGSNLYAGEQLRLAKGLVEIVYSQGSTVLLEGPATFNVADGDQGFLHSGSLVAKVGKGAEGFTIQTPAIDVVDLGTEFGVCVDEKQGTAKVEVFQGEVVLQAADKKQPSIKLRESLMAGQAVRVEMAGRQGTLPIVRKIATAKDTFVRQIPLLTPGMPKSLPESPKAVVADFSGGEGVSNANQFPGTAGSGWTTGWLVKEFNGLKWSTSIEQANPILGGGKYLQVLFESESDASNGYLGAEIERRLSVTDGVDLTKPYMVSFNFRVDALDGFVGPGDRLSLCSRCLPKVEGKREGQSSSGWHFSIVADDAMHRRSMHWAIVGTNKSGKVTIINSGIPVNVGNVYSFRIFVDPTTAQWTPSIAVNGGEWIEFKTMGMRSKGTAKQNDYWPVLYFYYRLSGVDKGKEVKRTEFSVDSIRYTQE